MKTNTKTTTAPLLPLSAPVGVSGVTLPAPVSPSLPSVKVFAPVNEHDTARIHFFLEGGKTGDLICKIGRNGRSAEHAHEIAECIGQAVNSHAANLAKIKALEEACNLLIREMQFTGKIREDFSRRVAVEAGKKALALPSA
jgi:hypothetical protein